MRPDGLVQQLIGRIFQASGIEPPPEAALDQFSLFLNLIERWNARLNLTSIRQQEEMIERHFVESVFAGQQIPTGVETLLDYGSGGGFPGIPIAICYPDIQVTLAESQGKKASFLREAVRVLGIQAEVFDGRVETMPKTRKFDTVTMRAVERMETAIPIADEHVEKCLLLLTTEQSAPGFRAAASGLAWEEPFHLPNSRQMIVLRGQRPQINVPRGT